MTIRGEEACEVCVNAGFVFIATRTLLAKTHQVTYRNPIEADDCR